MKDDLSQNIHGNMVFSVYSVKMVFFSYKYDIILLSKKERWDGISGIIEKDDVHPRKYRISSNKKIEDDKKVYLVKYTLGEPVRLM